MYVSLSYGSKCVPLAEVFICEDWQMSTGPRLDTIIGPVLPTGPYQVAAIFLTNK